MDKLFVKLPGTKVIGVVQAIFFLGAVACVFWAAIEENWFIIIYGVGLLVLGLLTIPFKSVVKAAEYYISKLENEYDVREGTFDERQITNSDL